MEINKEKIKDFLNTVRLKYRTLHLKYSDNLQKLKDKLHSYLPR